MTLRGHSEKITMCKPRQRAVTRNQISLQFDHEPPWISSIQKCEQINVCLSHLACSILLWAPELTKDQRPLPLATSLPQGSTESGHGGGGTSILEKLCGNILPRSEQSAKDAEMVPGSSVPERWCRKSRGQETGRKPSEERGTEIPTMKFPWCTAKLGRQDSGAT